MLLDTFNEILRYFLVTEPSARGRRELGECAWTLRVDNAGIQPKTAKG